MAPVESIVDASFETFTRRRWAALADGEPTRTDLDTGRLVATGESIPHSEVVDIYVPLSRLLALMAAARREAHQCIGDFLGHGRQPVPFIIGIAGGVAVGKSTTARVLQALLQRGDDHLDVALLTTDGFLYPNAILEERGLMARKGFPESYDQRALVRALAAIRSGVEEVSTPVYSHVAYDIVPHRHQVLRRPDIVIVEGLNVLQVNTTRASPDQVVVSDFFDFSIYVDADEDDVARWFKERLLALRSTVLQEADSFFHRFASLSDEEVLALAEQVWAEVNLVNLRENVAPTRGRAHLILIKDGHHLVSRLLLRRF